MVRYTAYRGEKSNFFNYRNFSVLGTCYRIIVIYGEKN